MSISSVDGSYGYDLSMHIKVEEELTLTEQFDAGTLQQNVRAKKINPHTLIHKAILENNAEVIKFLLQQGVYVDYADENGMTPLTIAILNRCNFAIDTLLQYSANVNPSEKWNDMSLVDVAINMKDIATAKLLISKGAKITAHNLQQILNIASSLYGTEEKEWSSFAEEVLRKGMNLNVDDQKNNTAENNIVVIVSELVLKKGKYDLMELLIQNGANINDPKLGERAPLIQAIKANRLDVVKYLVEHKADVNYTKRPLKYALFYNYPEVVQYLLQHGAVI